LIIFVTLHWGNCFPKINYPKPIHATTIAPDLKTKLFNDFRIKMA